MPAWILTILADPRMQAIIGWLVSKLWNFVADKFKDKLATDHLGEIVTKALELHKQLIIDEIRMSSDGLTDEERNEIRQRRAKIHSDIINIRP